IAVDIASQNWACFATRIGAISAVKLFSMIYIAATSTASFNKAKEGLKKYKFCGHDWLSYKETEDKKYWVRGGYENSHYKYVVDQIEKSPSAKKEITNQTFREYIYGGREHISLSDSNEKKPEEGFGSGDNRTMAINYDITYCIDPRTEEQKGFNGIFQRYYMRGNEKANFACNRFMYDGVGDCFLPGSAFSSDDEMVAAKKSVLGEDGKWYYLVDGTKYSKACQTAFIEARKCCRYRSKHLVCLHDGSKNGVSDGTFCFSNVVDGYAGDVVVSNLFLFLQKRNSDVDKATCKLGDIEFEAGKKKNTDHVCVFSNNMCPYDFKLNAGLNYRASYCDSDYFTDYRDSDSMLTREATHFNKTICEEGLFSENLRKKYKEMFSTGGRQFAAYTYNMVKKDMKGFNVGDFETIYNFDGYADSSGNIVKKPFTETFKENGENNTKKRSCGFSTDSMTETTGQFNLTVEEANYLKSSAFGKVKNFCQYRAHCVEVEREEEYNDSYVVTSLFLDSSCNGTTSNSRNILQDNGGGLPRQLSAPIVECVFESLKNLISGIAGSSLCETGEEPNRAGYCGTDSEETVREQVALGNKAFFDGRYRKIEDKFIIKNQELPPSYNPFLRIQRYFIRIIKAALALFMVIYFYKQLLMGNLDNLVKPENIMKMVFPVFKFAVVMWLIFYNGWQQGAYNYLLNFSTASYSFVSRMFIKILKNPKNQMLNLEDGQNVVIKVLEKNSVTLESEEILLCYKYDIFNNIHYSRRDNITKKCEKGFYSNYEVDSNMDEATKIFIKKKKYEGQIEKNIVISNNQEISQLIYFIDKYNKGTSEKIRMEVVSGTLWSKNYDGCYFDSTEYEENKNYLALFDTLDCKLIKYLGYSTNNMAPNILIYSAIMLVPGMFFKSDGIVSKIIGGIGSFLFGMMMSFLFLMFNVV
ncbi:MAG: hypothetical protein LBB24_01015, partial [Rickettsiales bacterium]|nr:hypothetical protein [Rickettsiales bacterium]